MRGQTLKQAHGNWVTGERFWDREEDIGLLTERLEGGAHILLTAQRRMGKTSLLRELAHRLDGRYLCLFLDLQQTRSASDAIVELSLAIKPYDSLWGKTKDVFRNALRSITEPFEKLQLSELAVTLRSGVTAGDWARKGDQLFSILASSEKPVLLMLDEVPIMINSMLKDEDHRITPERRRQADEFMSWLRKNSLGHQNKVRIAISGSIGLEPVLRQAGLSATINNFVPFELKPWENAVAIECLEAMANEYGLTLQDGAAAKMIGMLGCNIPHHVQMFFDHVHMWCRRHSCDKPGIREIEVIYRNEMLGIRGHAELSHYEERLKDVLGEGLLPMALDILCDTAVNGFLRKKSLLALQQEYDFEGSSTASVQNNILWVLEHDGYLKKTSRGYKFVSKLLQDWWNARHGFSFVPILKRGR